MGTTNNVTRMLDSRGIHYQAHELPKEKLGALEAAEYLGAAPGMMYKTIVATCSDGGKPVLALVPGPEEVEKKALAKALDVKKVKITSQREAEELTGLQTGGISPLALLQKGFQVVLDSSVHAHEEIYISGGQRGLNIQISTKDLIAITNAKIAEISG